MQVFTLASTLFVSGTLAQFRYGAPSYGASPYAPSPYGSPYGSQYTYGSSPYSPVPFGRGKVPGGSGSEYSFTGARCAAVNGQCYLNDCNGSRDYPYCRTGTWAGCPCGFECAPTNGPCQDNYCNGVPSGRKFGDGVCTTGNYVGCSCNLW